MTTAPKRLALAYALVQYRPDPAGRRIEPINLGVLMEFATNNTWAVGLAVRQEVDRAALQGLSELSRRLIAARIDIMKGEVAAALRAAQRPGDVVRILSERNPWSFHVAPPETVTVPAHGAAAAPTIEGVAEKHVLLAFSRAVLPARAARSARQSQARHAAEISAEVPPAWMLPTIFWHLPIGDRG
jgi:hypothetical protein